MTEDDVMQWKFAFRLWLHGRRETRLKLCDDLGVSMAILNQWASKARRWEKTEAGEKKPGSYYMPNAERRQIIENMMRSES